MKRIAELFLGIPVHHPKATLLILTLITIIACTGIPKLKFENSLSGMMPHDDIEYITNASVKKIYGNNGSFIILDIFSKDIFRPELFREIDNLITDIDEYRIYDEERENARIEKIDSIIAAAKPVTTGELIAAAGDDRPFARAILRKLKTSDNPEETLSKGDLKNLKTSLEVSRDIKKIKYVDTVISPFTMKDLSGKNDTLVTYDIMTKDPEGRRILPETETDFQKFRELLTRNPAFEHGIYSKDPVTGKITDFGVLVRLIDVTDHNGIAKEIRLISESYNTSGGMTVIAQGAPVLYKQITDYMQSDLQFFIPLVLLVICIIFYLNFRTAQGVVIPLITLLIADGWVLGLMGHLGYKLSVIGISLPPLILSVGSSYSIHIMNRFMIDSESIKKNRAAGLYTSMQMIGMTLLLASVTTIIGFMTNMATQVSSIFEWGLFAAIGTTFAVIIAALFIPAVFTFIDLKTPYSALTANDIKKKRKKGLTDRILSLCAGAVIDHTRAVLAGTAVIAILSAAGIFLMKTETSLHSYFKPDDYINRSSCEIGRKFGGTMGLNILIDSGNGDGVKNPEFLKKVETLRAWLVSPENYDLHVGRTDAFGDFVKTINMAMHNDDPAFYSIPDSENDIMDYMEIYSGNDENSDGRIDELEPYVDPGFSTVNLFARLSESENAMLGTSDISRIVERIRTHFEKELSPYGYKVTISGEPLIIISLAKYIVRGQLWSLFLSLVAVSIVVMVLFRNFRAGIISSVPISTAVLVNFGIMGWTGIRLDIATAIIASITVGIGVDNTIHFLNTYRHVKDTETSMDEAIRTALISGGKAIIFTALALIAGFSVLVISNFKPILLFGVMMGFTFIATTTGALLVLPALIRVTGFSFETDENVVNTERAYSESVRDKTATVIRKNRMLNIFNSFMKEKILNISDGKKTE